MERRPGGVILHSTKEGNANSHHRGAAIAADLTPLPSPRDIRQPERACGCPRLLATMASARGGSNGQLHAIRFQPICRHTRVMWKHFDCARSMRCFRHTYS